MEPVLYHWEVITAYATIAAAVGTFLAPLFALQVSAWLDRKRERQRQRFAIFQTLMQWRSATFTEQPVRALNSIDTVFYDVKPVRDAWADLFSAYCDGRLQTPEGARICQDKLTALLQAMALHLGYERSFTKADLVRVYNPEALAKQLTILLEQQRQTYAALFPPQTPPQQETAIPPRR